MYAHKEVLKPCSQTCLPPGRFPHLLVALLLLRMGDVTKTDLNHPPKTPCKFQEMHFSSFFDSSLNFFPEMFLPVLQRKLGKNCPLHWKKETILWILKTGIPVIQLAGCWSIIVSGKALAAEALKNPKKAKTEELCTTKGKVILNDDDLNDSIKNILKQICLNDANCTTIFFLSRCAKSSEVMVLQNINVQDGEVHFRSEIRIQACKFLGYWAS